MAAEDDFYASLGYSPDTVPQQPPMGGMASILQKNPIADAMKPPASPQELENRKAGWAQIYDKLQNDPHLKRALMTFGAGMMQPIGAGESALGNVGRSAVAGSATYQASQQAERTQGLAQREEARKEAETAAHVAESGERQATSIAARPGVEAESKIKQVNADVARETLNDKIRLVKIGLREAELKQSEAEKQAAVDQTKRDLDAARNLVRLQPEYFSREMRAEVDKLEQGIQQSAATTEEKRAKARQETAKATTEEMTTEIFRGLPKEEQQRLVSAKFGGRQQESGFAQQEKIHRAIYKGLPADDPRKKGKTEDQYVADSLSAGKMQDATKSLSDYVKAVDVSGGTPDPEIMQLYTDAIKMSAGARAGRGTPEVKTIPPAAIQYLKQHPETAAAFDSKYGPGMSKVHLGR